MKLYLILVLGILFSSKMLGQGNFEANRIEYEYSLNPNDTSQQILRNVYIQDSCGNEVEYVKFYFNEYESFESQLNNNKIQDHQYREYLYNENCLPLTVSVLDQEKNLIKSFLYKYDENGTEKELKVIDEEGNQISNFLYDYNAENQLIKKTRLDKNNNIDHVSIIEYNGKSKKKEMRIHYDFNDTIICNYTYNINEQLIVEEWSRIDGLEKEFEIYIYDVDKKKELFLDSQSNYTEEYRITYYENGLEKYWGEYNVFTNQIIRMTMSKYEFGNQLSFPNSRKH